MSVRNCFKFDGDSGTFNAEKQSEKAQTPTESQSGYSSNKSFTKKSVSRTSSLSSVRSMSSRTGIITSRSISQPDGSQSGVQSVLSDNSFEEILHRSRNADPMTSSIYGNLEYDTRLESGIFDPTEAAMSEGSSVDPESPIGSGFGLNRSQSQISSSSSLYPMQTSPITSLFSSNISPLSDITMTENVSGFVKHTNLQDDDVVMETDDHRCLLDILDVRLSDMDLFSAERVEKRHYKGKNLQQDLEFPSCVIQRQVCVKSVPADLSYMFNSSFKVFTSFILYLACAAHRDILV